MNFIIIHSVKLLDALPTWMLKDTWGDCVRMARELANYGQIDDPFLKNIKEFPVDDLVTYAIHVATAMYNRNRAFDPNDFNQWLFPTNKQNARYRLTYKNCKRYGLKRRNKHCFVLVDEPFTNFYGFGYIFNSLQEFDFISHLWVDDVITTDEWDTFSEAYGKLKGYR